MNDLKFALRQLRKSPGFTLVAVLTLALGIGLNTAIFSLINDLFLRRLPFKEPSRIVHLDNGDKTRDLADVGLSAPRYQLYRDGQTLFDGFAAENSAAQNSSPFTLTGLGDPVQIFGGRVTANYFDVLGVRPVRGRNFLPEEEESADVAMVTENFWQKRMGGDPRVIGRSVTLDGVRHTIQCNAATDYAWVTAHPFLPKIFRHHGDIGAFFFLRQEVASTNRTHPKNIKIIRCDPAGEDLHRIAQSGQSKGENVFRAETVEDCLGIAVMLKAGRRDCELQKLALAGVRIHVHDTSRLFER